MKITRSTKLYLNHSNTDKKQTLDRVLTESVFVINDFITQLWSKQDFTSKFIDFKVNTWLSARMQQALGKQALEIVKSQRKKRKKTQPIFGKKTINLDSRFVKFDFNQNSFDVWVTISSIGNKIKLKLPSKKHKHFNKFQNDGWTLKKSIRLIKDPYKADSYYIEVFFEKDVSHKSKGSQKQLGIDIGVNKLMYTSDNKTLGTNFKAFTNKISRKTQGSKAFKRALTERDNYINKTINELDLESVSDVVLENIKNIHKNKRKNNTRSKKSMNKLQRWTYSKLLSNITLRCELNGVHVHKVNPAYTSQTCSGCGAVHESSRNDERYDCVECGLSIDADYNAALNILTKYLAVGSL